MKRRQKPPLKPKNVILSIGVCAAICLAGVGYVWAKAQVFKLGKEIKVLEMRLDELRRGNVLLKQSYAAMCSPRELDAAVRRLELGLATPRADQIVRIEEPPAEREKAYASNSP